MGVISASFPELAAEIPVRMSELRADADRRHEQGTMVEERASAPFPLARRRAILGSLMAINRKHAKPFERGTLASFSVMGGNWEQYAEIVVSMVMAETPLGIEQQLSEINARLASPAGEASPE